MSSNQRTYESIYLKKQSYNTYTDGTIVKKYRVNNEKKKGVYKVKITKDKDGKKYVKIDFKKES